MLWNMPLGGNHGSFIFKKKLWTMKIPPLNWGLRISITRSFRALWSESISVTKNSSRISALISAEAHLMFVIKNVVHCAVAKAGIVIGRKRAISKILKKIMTDILYWNDTRNSCRTRRSNVFRSVSVSFRNILWNGLRARTRRNLENFGSPPKNLWNRSVNLTRRNLENFGSQIIRAYRQ